MWVPDIAKVDGPRYLALASALAEAIDTGVLPPGARLPPQRDLAERLKVTVGTIGRAYNILKARQLVQGEVGRGTFVRGDAQTRNLPDLLERIPGPIDFASHSSWQVGLPEAMAAAIRETASLSAQMVFQRYPPVAGVLSHRAAGAEWIRTSGLDVPAERIVICGGAQQAILIAMATLSGANDPVMVENVTYSGTKALATLLERKLIPVEMDEFGIIPEDLEKTIETTGCSLLYLQPTVHNPTGAVMPEKRRRMIADILTRHKVVAIEDDGAVGGLRERPLPLAHFAPEQCVYVSSLSKSVSPALRVAFIASPKSLFDRLSNIARAFTLSGSTVVSSVAASLIDSGAAQKLADEYFAALKTSHAVATECLENVSHRAHPAAFFVWIHLPAHWSPLRFTEAARNAGVAVVPGDNFAIGKLNPPAVRIAINPSLSPETLREGLEILKDLLDGHRTFVLTV